MKLENDNKEIEIEDMFHVVMSVSHKGIVGYLFIFGIKTTTKTDNKTDSKQHTEMSDCTF